MALAQILPSLHPTTKFPEVKQIYKWFSCHWQGFSDKFTTQLCLQLISSCNNAPPWHGRGDLIVVWLSWHSKRRMTEGNYCTSPVLSREQTKLDDFCCFRGQWVTVSISREWLSHSQPCPLVLTRNKAQKTTNPRCSLQFNFCRLVISWGKIRVESLSLQWKWQTLQPNHWCGNPTVLQELSSSVRRRDRRATEKEENSPSCFLFPLANLWQNCHDPFSHIYIGSKAFDTLAFIWKHSKQSLKFGYIFYFFLLVTIYL